MLVTHRLGKIFLCCLPHLRGLGTLVSTKWPGSGGLGPRPTGCDVTEGSRVSLKAWGWCGSSGSPGLGGGGLARKAVSGLWDVAWEPFL